MSTEIPARRIATKSKTGPFREGEAPAEPKRTQTIFQRLGKSLALPSGPCLEKRAQKTRNDRIVVRKNTQREKRFFNHRDHSAAEPQPNYPERGNVSMPAGSAARKPRLFNGVE